MTGHQTTLARTSKMNQTNSKSKRNDRSHTMIIKNLDDRLSILIAALYSLITHHCLLITALIIPLFQVFLSQNAGVPDQKLRCSKCVPGPFQGHSRFCSKFVPSQFVLFVPFVILYPSRVTRYASLELHQNYTKITPKLHRNPF